MDKKTRRNGAQGGRAQGGHSVEGRPINLRGELVERLDLLEHHLAPKQIERLHASRCGTAGTLPGAAPCHACSGRHPSTEAALRLRCVPWQACLDARRSLPHRRDACVADDLLHIVLLDVPMPAPNLHTATSAGELRTCLYTRWTVWPDGALGCNATWGRGGRGGPGCSRARPPPIEYGGGCAGRLAGWPGCRGWRPRALPR
jgi:hypothetical protein